MWFNTFILIQVYFMLRVIEVSFFNDMNDMINAIGINL